MLSRDLTITGNGSMNGGKFDRVRITGEGHVEGEVTCNRLKVMGTVNVQGNVKAKWTRVMGQVDVGGSLNTDVVKIMGELSTTGDCNSEVFKLQGTFAVDGLLNAGEITVRLFGPSRAKEIGGGKIEIKRRRLPMSPSNEQLVVETVEGDNIYLEYTRAEVVRGNRVDIGPGCDIHLVEYKEDYHQSGKAKVTEANRV